MRVFPPQQPPKGYIPTQESDPPSAASIYHRARRRLEGGRWTGSEVLSCFEVKVCVPPLYALPFPLIITVVQAAWDEGFPPVALGQGPVALPDADCETFG